MPNLEKSLKNNLELKKRVCLQVANEGNFGLNEWTRSCFNVSYFLSYCQLKLNQIVDRKKPVDRNDHSLLADIHKLESNGRK